MTGQHIGLLHPGEMGAAVAAQMVGAGHTVMWCPTGRSDATHHRAERAGLQPVADLDELLSNCATVLSICPPAAAEDLADDVAKHRFIGVFVDANAINPARVRRIADRLTAAGATVLDGSIIGPPPSLDASARLYLAGPTAALRQVTALVHDTRVEPVSLGDEIGAASALKMAFASYQKSARTLAALSHALAEHHGLTDHLLTEADRMSASPLVDRDFLPILAARAWRWAPEMREVAAALTDAALPGCIAEATATALDSWAALGFNDDLSIPADQ